LSLLSLLWVLLPPSSTLFPYTTLFRSEGIGSIHGVLYPHSAIGFITSGPPSDSLRLSCSFSNNQYVWHHSGYARCYTIISGLKRSEEHTSELQSRENLVCRLLLEKKKT